MKRNALVAAVAAAAVLSAVSMAQAQISSAQQSALRSNCRSDFMSHCSGVTPGGKDALMCLQKNVDALSGGCQAAVRATMPAPAAAAKPAEPPPPPPAAAAAPASAPAPAPAAAAPAAAPAPEVKVAAPPPAAIKPASPKPAASTAPAAIAPVAPIAAVAPAAPDPAKLKALKFTCRSDFKRLCKNVPEGPEAFACLQSHSARLSANCRTSVADLAASMPEGAVMPAAVVKPAPVAHPPKAPVVDAAAMVRGCKLDMVRHCRGVGVGGGRMIACLTAHEADLTVRCRTLMKITSPLH
ncbi:MAG: hypothetical protein ACTHLO_20225 [Pseudolabrys sp.]